SERKASDSDLRLADDSNKDILAGGSDKLIDAPGNKIELAGASDVLHGSDILSKAGSGTGEMPALNKPGSGVGVRPDDDLVLSDEDDSGSSDSVLDDEIRPGSKASGKAGSSTGKGSDVTLGSGDSGINLAPSDSGLSLENEPLDLGGGSAVESLELPEDEEVVA